MVKRKNDEEYINVLTTVRLDPETDKRLKETIKKMDISQSVFIRKAIKDAISHVRVIA